MKDYRPLVSSAPVHSILNAQTFHYTDSIETDIRKTFEKIARSRADARVWMKRLGQIDALVPPKLRTM